MSETWRPALDQALKVLYTERPKSEVFGATVLPIERIGLLHPQACKMTVLGGFDIYLQRIGERGHKYHIWMTPEGAS